MRPGPIPPARPPGRTLQTKAIRNGGKSEVGVRFGLCGFEGHGKDHLGLSSLLTDPGGTLPSPLLDHLDDGVQHTQLPETQETRRR